MIFYFKATPGVVVLSLGADYGWQPRFPNPGMSSRFVDMSFKDK